MSQDDEYKTGFFRKIIGKDILPKSLRDKYQFAFDNPTLGMTEEDFENRRTKKAKKKRKKAAEDMADLEFELGKKQKSGDVILPQQEMLGKITEGAKPFSAVNPKGSLPRKSPYFSRGGRAAIRGFKFGGIK